MNNEFPFPKLSLFPQSLTVKVRMVNDAEQYIQLKNTGSITENSYFISTKRYVLGWIQTMWKLWFYKEGQIF